MLQHSSLQRTSSRHWESGVSWWGKEFCASWSKVMPEVRPTSEQIVKLLQICWEITRDTHAQSKVFTFTSTCGVKKERWSDGCEKSFDFGSVFCCYLNKDVNNKVEYVSNESDSDSRTQSSPRPHVLFSSQCLGRFNLYSHVLNRFTLNSRRSISKED